MASEISHGRGGAGNINADDTEYVDGEVVRAGAVGSHGDGAYSAGRGGAGNIGDARSPSRQRNDQDVVPEAAVRPSQDSTDFHTGRGGVGNEVTGVERPKKSAGKTQQGAPMGLADRLKAKLFGAFKK